MQRLFLFTILALSACEAKAPQQASTAPEDEFPPVPTMSAAPTGDQPVLAEPPTPPAELADDEAAEPAAGARAKKSAGPGGLGSVGAGGGGADGSGSVGELLEAGNPLSWTVSVAATDGDLDTSKQALRRGQRGLLQCATFLGESVVSMRVDLTLSAGVVKSAKTSVDNATARSCIESRLAPLRFDAKATTVSIHFRR